MIDVRDQNKNIQNKRKNKSESSKGRNRRSKVWEDFTLSIVDGSSKAVCNSCGRMFDGSSKKGTTHLKNHLESCRRKRNNIGGGDRTDKSIKTNNHEEQFVIDLIKCAEKFTTEHRELLKSRMFDILQIYREEKEKLGTYLNNLSCRFSLIIQMCWDTCCLIVRYIDDNWELKTKIIGCLKDQSIDEDEILKAKIKDVCLEWKIDRNICFLCTFDSVERYEIEIEIEEVIEIVGELNSWFDQHGSLPHFGHLFDVHWLRSFLFAVTSDIILRFDATKVIQRCLNYIHVSPSHEHVFEIAVDNKGKSMSKKLTSQCLPKSICNVGELEIAVGFKEVFCEVEQMDPDFKSINLTKEHWDEVTVICEHLKPLYDFAGSLVEGKYTTPNVYFPIFCEIYTKLKWWKRFEHFGVAKEASIALDEFVGKFWSKCKLTIAIAVVLDPRFKMDIVEKWYKEIYGREADEEVEKVRVRLTFVFNEYAKGFESGDATISTSYQMLNAMGRPCMSLQEGVGDDMDSPKSKSKSELDLYLNELKVPAVEVFDILAWWRGNAHFFPTLARVARDVLAIPINLERFYENYENILYDQVLDWDVREALVCLRKWM